MNNNLPAAKAVQGYEGLFEGMDYRGIPVVSYLSKIPGSNWFMVSKVDKNEIYSPLIGLVVAISLIALLAIFTFSALIIYFWRNQRLTYLKELSATKDKFFSIVSHDLRSPFSGIIGVTKFMIEDVEKEDLSTIKEYAKLILASSQNAMNLLKNLSDWSRLNTNRLAFNPTEIDIVIIINEVVELLSSSAMQKSITIIKMTPSHLGIYADRDMMSSVFQNLVSNSIKFSNPEGKIHITVTEKEKKVMVEITDFGVGIKKEAIDKLFSIGENVSTPGTQLEVGTGLGLILVKEFITMHGGEIHVKSEVGKSSSFMVTLPLR